MKRADSTYALALSCVLLLAASCGDSAQPPSSTSNDDAPRSHVGFGTYEVGVTTLALRDRQVEVWYPVDSSAVSGQEKASYKAFEVLPQGIIDILPPELNLEIPMDAYRDLPISVEGPFPILTFSHGAGGFPQAYSGFLSRLASHGLVATSIDHPEWGLLEQVGLRAEDAVDREAADVLLETVSRLEEEGRDPESVLSGGVDATQIATSGHSAGGRAAFALPDREEVKTMIVYATGSARGVDSEASILLLVGEEDAGAGRLEEAYEELAPEKHFVSVLAAGHNSFTDQCAVIHGGNNFLDDLVAAGFPIPTNLLALAIDGCLPENLTPATFWDVATHFTVAAIRSSMGLAPSPPDGLDPGISEIVPGVDLRYRYAR